MKKFYILFAFVFIASFSKATKHQISVLSMSFSPAAVNATCGDTIIWVLANLTQSHTTTSVSIPSGASGWGANLNSTATTYSIQLTVAGTYSYVCTIHISSGMAGSITVACPNGVSSISGNYFSAAYPNPFTSKLTIENSDAEMIAVYNALGENIRTIALPKGQTKTEIDGRDLKQGIYFYCILKEGLVIETKKVIKN